MIFKRNINETVYDVIVFDIIHFKEKYKYFSCKTE